METKWLPVWPKKKLLIIVPILPILILTAFLLSGPVLLQTYLFADLFGNLSDPPLIIMSPLRNKDPEMIANSFLNQLQTLEPSTILRSVIKNDADFEHICLMEKEHRLKTWSDYTREDRGDEVVLTYWPLRESYLDGFAPPIIIKVGKVGNDLRVIFYNALY